MTFSLIGRSKDGTQLGVAVASKFLAVGAYVTAASADGGAVATQAYGNLAFKKDGLAMLERGVSPETLLHDFLQNDPQKDERQLGVVAKDGSAATYTGSRCQPWAGGKAAFDRDGSYAAQGNMLAGAHVIGAMVETWRALADEPSLAIRLVRALDAGQTAGGDPRGKQAAAVLVVEKNGGYGGASDVVVDLRCDDAAEPIQELLRMTNLHQLYFGTTPAAQLLPLDQTLQIELQALLKKIHYDSGDLSRDLYDWMGRENFEERWHDNAVDPVVLKTAQNYCGAGMKPLIGITTGEIRNLAEPWSPVTYGQSYTYSDAIIRAGGLPVFIPITSDLETLRQIYGKLDGVLFAGGNDLDPQLYGQKPYTETNDFSPARDHLETELMRLTLADHKPMLAICRGMQLLNVARGGTLYQDIATDLAAASDHEASTHKKTLVDLAHVLAVAPESRLAAIIRSDTIAANTHHHQAINQLADGLRVSARAEDGLIEAIELADERFAIGLQCHPESLSTVEPKWDLVFGAFVASARS